MHGSVTARIGVVLCVLLLGGRALASDSAGILHPTCQMPYRYMLEITDYRGHRLEQAINFGIILDFHLNEWVDLPPGEAKSRRVQVAHLSHHWWQALEMSGNFEIVFADDRRLDGPFKAKYVTPPGRWGCE